MSRCRLQLPYTATVNTFITLNCQQYLLRPLNTFLSRWSKMTSHQISPTDPTLVYHSSYTQPILCLFSILLVLLNVLYATSAYGSHCVGNKHLLVCKIIDARLRIETRVGVWIFCITVVKILPPPTLISLSLSIHLHLQWVLNLVPAWDMCEFSLLP